MGDSRSAPGGVFADADFDYETRIVLGAAAAGIGDAGLVLAALDQPRQLYDLLLGEKKITGFSQAQGANFHCQPTGRQLTHTQMLDWLADRLPARQAAGVSPRPDDP